MHERLLQSGRGGTKNPGEFRLSQNWIGGSRPGNALFVPPPPTEMGACLDALERFMHEDGSRLAEKVWMALGLSSRTLGGTQQRIIYDDLSLPEFGVAEGEITTQYYFSAQRDVQWTMSNE